MLVVGDHGPTVDEAVDMNSRMDPAETALVKVMCLQAIGLCASYALKKRPKNLGSSV